MKNSDLPVANEPLVHAPRPNEEVTAFAGTLSVEAKGRKIEGEGRLFFRWLPSPCLRFEIAQPGAFSDIDLTEATLEAPAAGIAALPAGVLSISQKANPADTSVAGVILDEFSLRGDGTEMTTVAFDVPNFHRIAHGSRRSTSRLTLEAGDWLVDIDATADVDQRLQALCSVGGFVVTHAGLLRRTSGESFSFADTSTVRSALSTWLSFSRGLWCSPIFWHSKPYGWTHYSCPRLSRWRAVQSWFPLLYCDRVPSTFPRMVEILADPIWKDPFELAIYWYVHANECAGGVEGSLVLIQTAFEMLAWTYLVKEKRILTKGTWQRLKGAVARIEQLLTKMGIPTDLPVKECPELRAWAKSAGHDRSGPDALVGIRNAFVHSDTKNLKKALAVPTAAKREAWQLALLYLESIILTLLDYDGSIYSRIRSGYPSEVKVERPWLPV
ncbi:MAG TPA: hypothetical protein VJH03_19090 [Blastocatellia bacterium]|nr:hypothetical protein [Blastocatellia bacterium]